MSWLDLSPRWQNYFIEQLHSSARMSKDANTKVGALILDTANKVVISTGWNDLPRGVLHTEERNSRPLKYLYTSHAETSCLTNALRLNAAVAGHTMLVTMACCPQCSCSVVNSGLSEIVTPTPDLYHAKYGADFVHSINILGEGGLHTIFDDSLILPVE